MIDILRRLGRGALMFAQVVCICCALAALVITFMLVVVYCLAHPWLGVCVGTIALLGVLYAMGEA
jgi:hypothetical protein